MSELSERERELRESWQEADAARMPLDGAGSDPTGLTELLDVLRPAHQVYTAARLSGFSEVQAFQLARDYMTTMIRLSVEREANR